MSSTRPKHPAYHPLNHQLEEIRLVTFEARNNDISCLLLTVKLAAAPPYDALSYVWGDAKIAGEVLLDGSPIQATVNLIAALRQLRNRQDVKYLWLDAFCIDQSSIIEKNYQVPLMNKIYTRANRVIMWLGEAADESKLAIALIKRWGAGVRTARAETPRELQLAPLETCLRFIEDPFHKASFNAAEKFFQRDYWKRVWIIQEIVLAPSRLIICGSEELDYDSFHTAHTIWSSLYYFNRANAIPSDVVSEIIMLDKSSSISAIRRLLTEKKECEAQNKSWIPDILYLIFNSQTSLSTDPRDKIFGFFGLLEKQELPMQPDYGSEIEKVHSDFAVGLISKSQSLDSLSVAGIGFSDGAVSGNTERPSWVPDFSKALNRSALIYFGGYLGFSASKNLSNQFRFYDKKLLQATGMLTDRIGAMLNPDTENILEQGLEKVWDWLELAAALKVDTHPSGIPWRQAFFRNLIADRSSSRPTSSGLNSEQNDVNISMMLESAEGFMTAMRTIALWKAKLVVDTEQNQMHDSDLSFDSCVAFDIPSLLSQQVIDKEVALWLYNSSTTSDELMRRQSLDSFCGPEDDPNRLSWPFTEYACSPQTMNLHKMLMTLRALSSNRCFYTTRNGYMGLGPRYAQLGDQICILAGCSVPLVVRQQIDGKYILVGDTYIYGMMQGEMVDEMEKGKHCLENVVLQ